MSTKLVGIVALLLSNFVLFASAEESLEQRIAQKSQENRVAENIVFLQNRSISQRNRIETNLVKFNAVYERRLEENKPEITYDVIRLAASFGSCQSTKNKFRALLAELPRFYDIAALQQARVDMQEISKKLPK